MLVCLVELKVCRACVCTLHNISRHIPGVLITRNLDGVQQGSACITLFKGFCQVVPGAPAAKSCNLTRAAQPCGTEKQHPASPQNIIYPCAHGYQYSCPSTTLPAVCKKRQA